MSDRVALFLALWAAALATACDDGGAAGDPPDTAAIGGDAAADASPPDGAAPDATAPDAAPLAPLDIPEGCNPLAADIDCLLPFPTDFFVEGEGEARRVAIPAAALPVSQDGEPIDFLAAHPADGSPVLPQIAALFPVPIDDAALPFFWRNVEDSLEADCPTVLLAADTGERVLHIAELDPSAEDDTRRVLSIRPLVRLRNDTRYLVAIRGLQGPDGTPLAPPEGFRRLRDGEAASTPALAALAARFETDVFGPLTAAGVTRGDLLLAWDFTTRTEADATRDMLDVRAAAMAAFEVAPPAVTITSVEEDVDAHTARRIEGTLRVPLFMENAGPGAWLNRGADGRVEARGEAEVPFFALVPRSVADGGAPARLLQFGHGFFGIRYELERNFIFELADELGVVVIAVDWWGMSTLDVGTVLNDLALAPSQTYRFTDRLHQAMANQIAIPYAARATLLAEPAFQIDGAPAYDPDRIFFLGISQGHILGGTYLALAPHITRGVLSVGGAGFSLIMMRARPFVPYLALIEKHDPDPVAVQKFIALSQLSLDRIDPVTYAPHVLDATYPGGPVARAVLMQLGVGDAQVPPVSGHAHARALGLAHLQPAPRALPGFETVNAPYDGSALAEFAFGVPEPYPGTSAEPAPDETPTHESVRRNAGAIQQLDAFLRVDGRVEHFCDGPCDPD